MQSFFSAISGNFIRKRSLVLNLPEGPVRGYEDGKAGLLKRWHWVDRGPEPDGLSVIRSRFKQRWIDHYQNGVGNRPTDARWREFHPALSRAFSGLCAYCEEPDKGEVDHFRPSSKFPHLVYEWTKLDFRLSQLQSKPNQTSGLMAAMSILAPKMFPRGRNDFSISM